MCNLFPDEQVAVDFSVKIPIFLGKNKKTYYIGKEKGVLKKYEGNAFSGYEFHTIHGFVYFLSKNKDKYPTESYNAVFYLQLEKEQELTLEAIQSCKKKLLVGKHPFQKLFLLGIMDFNTNRKNKTNQEPLYNMDCARLKSVHYIQF